MTKLNTTDLTRLRQRPHQTQLWLSIYRPKTRFAASILSGTMDGTRVHYASVTTGSYGLIQPNSTMLIGTAPGTSDIGKIRVRGATGTYIDVAPNDDIPWGANQYLTVLDFHEVFPIFPKADEAVLDDDDDALWYVDWDKVYTNQNSVLGTQVCMGGNYAGFVEDSVFYSSSGTYNVKDEAISAYEWWFEGATVTGSTSADPGFISYPSPGHFITRLKVTSASGGVDYGYRHVSIYNRSDKQPIRNWGLESLSGSRDEGGYNGTIWVREILPNLLENSLVVIFADNEYFGGDLDSIGGNQINREKIVFSGYIRSDSIEYDYKTSMTTFEVAGVTNLMKEKEGMSYSYDDATTATKWQHIQDMNLKKALWEYCKYYSTIGEVADVRYIGDDGSTEFFEGAATNLYDSLNDYFADRIYSKMVADRQGTIFVEPSIQLTHNATGVYPVGMDLEKVDWINEPNFMPVQLPPISYIEIGGSAYSGQANGNSIPYMSNAPGDIQKYSGKVEIGASNLFVDDQADLNVKCGDIFAYMNAKYPEISFDLAGNYRNFDIAPYEQVIVTINKDDTHRQLVLPRLPCFVDRMEWEYSSENGILKASLTLHEITHSIADGQTLPIPETPDENFAQMPPLPEFEFPNFCGSALSVASNTIILEPELPPCAGDIAGLPNGFWDTGIRGVKLESNDLTTFRIPYTFWYRGSSYDNRTTYTINGKWYKRDTTSSPPGAWELDTADDWYEIYLSDNLGNRIGQAIKDPVVGNGYQRTGVFNVAQGLQIASLEIALDPDTNPITTVDWSPFTIYLDHSMTQKSIPGGVYLEDLVRRTYKFGFGSGFENGSIWTPRSGAGYPDGKLFDVTYLLYGLGKIDDDSFPNYATWNRQRFGLGTNTDTTTVLDINKPSPSYIDVYASESYHRYDLGKYSAEWLVQGTAVGRTITTRGGYYHNGGSHYADVIMGTELMLQVKSTHMLVIDGFFLWNICSGGRA